MCTVHPRLAVGVAVRLVVFKGGWVAAYKVVASKLGEPDRLVGKGCVHVFL
jgi:hypothetical protein